jgi:hypothetical protein
MVSDCVPIPFPAHFNVLGRVWRWLRVTTVMRSGTDFARHCPPGSDPFFRYRYRVHLTKEVQTVDDFMTRDLPAGIDLNDQDGIYDVRFDYLRMTDDTNEFGRVLELYANGSPEDRILINNVMIHLCGYSLPTLVEDASENSPLGGASVVRS